MNMDELVDRIWDLSKICKYRSNTGNTCGAVKHIFLCDPFVCPKCGVVKE